MTEEQRQWKTSRYTRFVRIAGKGGMLYNSYTGAIAAVSADELEETVRWLDDGTAAREEVGLKAELCAAGFLVPADTDEWRRAGQFHEALKEARSMHLVLLPTEACNFRCSYCYQKFQRGTMTRDVIEGLKAYVREAAERIDHLSVSWFGGEPLLAFDAIMELSDSFMDSCARNGAGYSADMSTNGYGLTKEKLVQLAERQVRRYMVTVDGKDEVHDRRRRLVGGGPTYRTIIDNLRELLSLDDAFTVDLRVNFDEDNVGRVKEWLDELSGLLRGDRRFGLLVRPIGRWGGPRDALLPVCDRTSSDRHLWELAGYGQQVGLPLSEAIADALMPAGSVCYAAKPNSLIVGADGQLYKCSVALDDEANQVGKLNKDGTVVLDPDKMALWTDSGEEQDEVCRSCFYRPACQGNHCPLYRMRTGKRPCPHEKRKLGRVLALLWKNDAGYEGGEQDEAD
ncbi:radical SAM protein [Cohnella hongkongensis]|uniref:Radical SAM protein n=1 Tax=Cohnella hongkongensis TaxID=178337 RepID=A0ABV9FAB7_9BACL